MTRPQVLEGLKVVDFSRALAGPSCAQLLADMGAEVIKVEGPKGDENRYWPPLMPDGQSCNFASVNRGKRGMTLDLKSEFGPEILRRLVLQADVLIHSFLPDTAERLGISWEKMRAINPRLVFCSITGYGTKGELRNKAGYDLMVQAFSGVMSVTGYEGGPPTRAGVSFVDMSTGLAAYGGIVTALLNREKTGEGEWVRASLLETSVALLGYHAVAWLQAGIIPKKQGSGGSNQVPYQAFKARDGYMLVGAPNNDAWQRLCGVLADPVLGADTRFHSNITRVQQRDLLIPLLEAHFLRRDVAEWVDLLEAAGVAVAAIHTLDQVLTHPQVIANDMVVQAEDAKGESLPLLGMPFKLGDAVAANPQASPHLDADTETILRGELGFSEAELARMRPKAAE